MTDFAITAIPWLPIAIVLIGYLVFGLTGFGSALIIIPLLSWRWPLSTIVPLVLLLDVLASLMHAGLNLRQVRWQVLPAIAPYAVAGAFVGVYLHKWSQSKVVLGILGVYILLVATQGVLRKKPIFAPQGISTVGAGFAMGAVETLFGTAGPIVIAWLTRQIRSVEAVRATAPVMIIMLVFLALISNGLAGQVDGKILLTYLAYLLPSVAVGVWTGHRLSKVISISRLEKFIYAGLFLSGSSLVSRAIL